MTDRIDEQPAPTDHKNLISEAENPDVRFTQWSIRIKIEGHGIDGKKVRGKSHKLIVSNFATFETAKML